MGLAALLRRTDFRLLFAGQALSMFGDSALLLVLAIWVKELTGSNGAAGLTLVFVALPSLIGPLGGWVVDHVRRRPFLVVTNLCSALSVLPLLAVRSREHVWVIYAVATLFGTLLVLHLAALNALLKTMLPESALGEANAVLQTVKEALRLVAPLTGAALYALVGGAGVALLDGLTFVGAAIALGALSVDEPVRTVRRQSIRGELAAGLRFLWRARPLLHVTVALALALLVVGIAESVVFAIVEWLRRPPEFVGVVVAVQGVGAVLGGFAATRLIRTAGEVRTVIVGLATFSVGAVVMIAIWLPVVVIGIMLAGFGLPLVLVGFITSLQRSTSGALIGRVTTAAYLVIGIPQTISVALGALLVSMLDYRLLLGVMAGGTLLAVVYLVLTSRGEPSRPDAVSLAAAGTVPGAMSASRAMGWALPPTPSPDDEPPATGSPAELGPDVGDARVRQR
ncbi:MFS transporter [Cryptosporangium aurantiacum]|uniref:Na+/melibiose symporter n=1 Tax=Cryptosporangium aurantiacum TaxID=134849 RepID=A0A1M7QP36_9ACTN|nr:MFS transporter [Cryptosporangium aurantiacum]SHN32897.1 Na+/melibiose symporter [Cryptosporangium aurantiacum]